MSRCDSNMRSSLKTSVGPSWLSETPKRMKPSLGAFTYGLDSRSIGIKRTLNLSNVFSGKACLGSFIWHGVTTRRPLGLASAALNPPLMRSPNSVKNPMLMPSALGSFRWLLCRPHGAPTKWRNSWRKSQIWTNPPLWWRKPLWISTGQPMRNYPPLAGLPPQPHPPVNLTKVEE